MLQELHREGLSELVDVSLNLREGTFKFCQSALVHLQGFVDLGLHELSEDMQKSPVADVQPPEVPQTQGAGLAVAPSPWAQAGPVKAAHRQALELEESQEAVEAVFVLKYRLPPLLLLLKSKHPRG